MIGSRLRPAALLRRGTLIPPTGTTPTSRTFCSEHFRKLEGKVVLITGGANGIGRAAAAKFVSHGAQVVIADIQEQNGRELANELGSSTAFVRCDVSQESDVSDAVDFAVSKYGCLNVMYNNAGVPCRTARSFVDLDLGRFDQIMSINVKGVVAGIKHAARVMIPRGSGSILCMASVTGVLGGMAQHTYSISKSAVIGVVRSAASELCRHGIRINSISPFAVPTNFVMEELRLMYPGLDDSRLMNIIHDSGVLKGTNCETDDVANAALYLASDDAKYVNGHNLVVDGGFTVMTNLGIPAPEDFIENLHRH